MKTNFFSLATVLMAIAATALMSCSKSDNPYVIESQDNSGSNKKETNTNIEFVACTVSEALQYFDIVATTNSGESYTVVAGVDVNAKDLLLEDKVAHEVTLKSAPICKMKAASFRSTGNYIPVTLTAKLKEGVTIPENFDFAVLAAMEKVSYSCKGNLHKSSLAHGGIKAPSVEKALKVVNKTLAMDDYTIRQDGMIVFKN